MPQSFVTESELMALARKCRQDSGKTRAQVARELKVAAPTMFQAEEQPAQSLHKLRARIIEACSEYEVIGPVYLLKKKSRRLR